MSNGQSSSDVIFIDIFDFRANRRTSQESKRIFDVIDVSNEAETAVSSTSSSTTDFGLPESNMVPHALTTDSLDSAKNYHYSLGNSCKETYLHSQYPANRRDSDADWSSTLSDIYTDMTTQSKEIETMYVALIIEVKIIFCMVGFFH